MVGVVLGRDQQDINALIAAFMILFISTVGLNGRLSARSLH